MTVSHARKGSVHRSFVKAFGSEALKVPFNGNFRK